MAVRALLIRHRLPIGSGIDFVQAISMRDGHSCRHLAQVKGNENRAVSLETSRRRDLLSFIGRNGRCKRPHASPRPGNSRGR